MRKRRRAQMSGRRSLPEPTVFHDLFFLLCNPALTKEERRDIFDALLKTPGGPFMDSDLPMRRSVRNLARHVTTSMLRKLSLPSSYVNPDDVAHDALIVFVEQSHRIRDVRRLRSWLWSVMTRMVLKELGKDWKHVGTSDLTLADHEQEASCSIADDKSDAIHVNPRVDALHAALDELSPSLRDVVKLHGLEGHSHVEIARVLGIDPTAVRVRWFRAKRELKKKLAREVRLAS